MFLGSAAVLVLTGWLLYRSGRAGPKDPELAMQCEQDAMRKVVQDEMS